MKTKRKILTKTLTLLMIMLLTLVAVAGCQNGADKPDTSDPAESASTAEGNGENSKLKVALVLPGTVNDEGWNATAYAALQMIKENLGYDVAFSESVQVSDFTQVYRGYAEEGYNLIIGHGSQFLDPAREIHDDYPDIWFAVTSTNEFTPPNVCAVDTNQAHAGYLNGVIAAMMTKTGKVGLPVGVEIPGVLNYEYGFKEGVKATKPEVEVIATYTGSFEDVTAMKEITKSMINQGADIIAPNGDQSGVGAFQAVNEAEEGIYVMGVYGDQRSLAPDRTLVSAVIDMQKAIEEIAKLVGDGKAEAKSYMSGIREGAVYLTEYHDAVPQEVRDHVEEVIAKFETGELDVVRPAN